MKAKEFIFERTFSHGKSAPMKTTYMFPEMPSADPYQAYRFGLAMADHTLTYAKGPTDRNAVVVAIMPEEEEIIKGGMRQTGKKGVVVADKESHESVNTGIQSPVAQFKKNRYGV